MISPPAVRTPATPYTPERVLAQSVISAAGVPADPGPLTAALSDARAAGWAPFEVVAGAPAATHGPRITLRRGRDEGWLGLRLVGGAPASRRYTPGVDAAPPLKLPLVPVMSAGDPDDREHYWRLAEAMPWDAFAAAALALVGATPAPWGLRPRPSPGAFGLSVRRRGDRVHAVTLYARERALPHDEALRRAWGEALGPDDRAAYEKLYALVRSLGPRPPRGWHALAAWTFAADGAAHRAVSLRVPAIGDAFPC
jgi:hypothetical protein